MTRREFNLNLLTLAGIVAFPRALLAATPVQPPNPFPAVDTHAHNFLRTLKFAEGRRYTPAYDATTAAYLTLLDTSGLSHSVLIQPSFLGTDNSFMVDALKKNPRRLRGVAVVEPSISERELVELASAGIVGIRLNLVGQTIPDFKIEPWPMLLRHVAKLDWHVEVQREAKDLPQIVAPLLNAGVNVVVDHFGRPDPKLGIEDPGFRYLLTTASTRRVWVKLSAAYRNGPNGRGEEITRTAAPLLRDAFGAERLLWGSDWPHTQFESSTNYAATRALLDTWITSPVERATILGETPANFFHFA